MTSYVWLLWALQLLFTASLGSNSVVITININTVATIIHTRRLYFQRFVQGFRGGAVVKNLPANAGDTGSSPGPGRFPKPQSN